MYGMCLIVVNWKLDLTLILERVSPFLFLLGGGIGILDGWPKFVEVCRGGRLSIECDCCLFVIDQLLGD